jgi:lipoprotein-anchoring transpeptidase ErfK/SrfK
MPPSTGRGGRASRRSAVIVAIVLACLAGIATALVLTMPRVTPVGPLELTNDASPTVQLTVAHPAGLGPRDVTVTVDGDEIDGDRIDVEDAGTRIVVRIPSQNDGTHEVKVVTHGVGILQRTITNEWKLRVDTTPPAERIVSPAPADGTDSAYVAGGVAPVTKAPMQLTVSAEEGAAIDVTSTGDGAKPTHADASSEARRTIAVPLPQGAQLLTVTATDKAGNETTRRLRVLVDTIGPRITAKVPLVVRDNTLALPVAAHDPHGVELKVVLDGNELEDVVETVSTTPPPNLAAASESTDEIADETTETTDSDAGPDSAGEESDTPDPIAGQYRVVVEDGVLEGRHTLEIVATDSLGTKTTFTRRLLVDSGEDLGDVEGMRAGARGRDVSQLHQALMENGIVNRGAIATDIRTRTYGPQTRAAVMAFQRQRGMSEDGIAGGDTIAALTLKIVVDRGANTLTLYRMGDVVKTYNVATGSPEYPTPAGDFEIQTMQENPTWTPPDSAWAKDAEVIPPGPDNPLGTRWMAINGTVGIHGTNNPASIGYSVSHGCIRMRIPDVEELFSMVEIGTPVTVL